MKDRMGLAIGIALVVAVAGMAAGGVIAALQQRGIDTATATMIATVMGGLVAGAVAIATGQRMDTPEVKAPEVEQSSDAADVAEYDPSDPTAIPPDHH